MIATKESQTSKILKLLKEHKVVTNAQLNKVCFRYSARIHELRKDGYIIVASRINEGLFRYTYKGHREDETREYPDVE